MTSKPNGRHGPRTGRARDVGRALGAVLSLAVLVVGIPAALLLVAPALGWPDGGWSGVISALSRPDDGHLFLAALGVVAWASWAVFALSVVVEIVAVARRLPTPRLPLIGGPQKLAASLVASAALMLAAPHAPPPAATPVAALATPTAPDPIPLAADAPHRQVENVVAPAAEAPQARGAARASRTTAHPVTADHRVITVRRGDTLWDLAEAHLGDGSRYREIARLNYGRPQPDGRTLTDAHWIYPGWRLLLPAISGSPNQHPAPPAAKAPSRAKAHEAGASSYRVKPGDTLWDIAATHLGDPLRYHEIYQLNRNRFQADGATLDDPRVIVPGWTLLLPPRHTSSDPTTAPPSKPAPAATPTETSQPPAAAAPPAPRRTAPAEPTIPAATIHPPTPTAPGQAAPPDDQDAHAAAEDSTTVDISRLVLGLTALTATGFLAELARRRRRQQQHRRPGERIPLPTAAPAAAEQELRAARIPITLATVTAALTQLAANARAQDADLPRVLVVLVGQHDVDVVVDGTQAPVAPFTAATGAGAVPRTAATSTWRLDTSQFDAADEQVSPHGYDSIPCSAYPALVAVGTSEDRMLLINLEAAGTLAIDTAQIGQQILRTLAVELATSPLSAGISLILPGDLDDLADVADPDRVAAVDPSAAGRRAAVRRSSVRTALDNDGLTDLHHARAEGRVSDTWTPEIYIGLPDMADPWSGVVTITAQREDQAAEAGWRLMGAADTARLEPLGITVQPSRLSDDDYASLIALLSTGNEAPTTPAQSPPTGTDDLPPLHVVDDIDLRPDTPTAQARTAALISRRNAVLAALPNLDTDSCAPSEPDDPTGGAPRILLLGRVDVLGASTPSTPRRGRSLELLAYLALHPGATPAEIDDALWPGQRVTDDMRNSLVSRTRTWLGTALDGAPYLSHVTPGDGYRLHPHVTTDWHQFIRRARLALGDECRAEDLSGAFDLVRGRPFLGVDPAAYAWAEADMQEMISSVVDVAHEAAARALVAGDVPLARSVLAKALTIDPANEALYQTTIAVAEDAGDKAEVARVLERMREQLRAIDPDFDLSEPLPR